MVFSRLSFAEGLFAAAPVGQARVWTSTGGGTWNADDLPQAVHGTEGSDGRLWLAGQSGFIARHRAAPVEIRLSGDIDGNGRFMVTVRVPEPGSYRLESRADLGSGSWETTATLQADGSQVTWTDPNIAQGNRFFRVVRP